MTACPPWDLTVGRPQAGLFPAPPLPSQLRRNVGAERALGVCVPLPVNAVPRPCAFWEGSNQACAWSRRPQHWAGRSTTLPAAPCQATRVEHYTDLISIEVVHTINAALCEQHLKRCPPSEELVAACGRASRAYDETLAAARALDAEMQCTDVFKVGGRGGPLPAGPRWQAPALTLLKAPQPLIPTKGSIPSPLGAPPYLFDWPRVCTLHPLAPAEVLLRLGCHRRVQPQPCLHAHSVQAGMRALHPTEVHVPAWHQQPSARAGAGQGAAAEQRSISSGGGGSGSSRSRSRRWRGGRFGGRGGSAAGAAADGLGTSG
jgi:uncharacterized membrane protein YgcG